MRVNIYVLMFHLLEVQEASAQRIPQPESFKVPAVPLFHGLPVPAQFWSKMAVVLIPSTDNGNKLWLYTLILINMHSCYLKGSLFDPDFCHQYPSYFFCFQ
jgi:hypothetical protein